MHAHPTPATALAQEASLFAQICHIQPLTALLAAHAPARNPTAFTRVMPPAVLISTRAWHGLATKAVLVGLHAATCLRLPTVLLGVCVLAQLEDSTAMLLDVLVSSTIVSCMQVCAPLHLMSFESLRRPQLRLQGLQHTAAATPSLTVAHSVRSPNFYLTQT